MSVPIYLNTREQLLALGLNEATINNLPSFNVDQTWLDNVSKSVSPILQQTGLHVPSLKGMRQEEPEESKVKLNDLPELPFKLILSHLSLGDRTKLRLVSRKWCRTIDSFRPKSVGLSAFPKEFIFPRNYFGDTFAQNFINSTRPPSFLSTFSQSILSALKHLRLCQFDIKKAREAMFVQNLNSFGGLEKLDIFNLEIRCDFGLSLPMLNCIQLDYVNGIKRLTLNAPKLQNVRIWGCSSLRLNIVDGKSVERLVSDSDYTDVKNLKNLQYLSLSDDSKFDSTFLSDLKMLKEVHFLRLDDVEGLFEQKQRYGLVDLKVYLFGLLLKGPDDPAISILKEDIDEEFIACLAKNESRLAVEILFSGGFDYSVIERGVPPGSEICFLKRFTSCCPIVVNQPVQDIGRFLYILRKSKTITALRFECKQHQDLFDRLPGNCAVQMLDLFKPITDLEFLLRLKDLVLLTIDFSIDVQIIRQIVLELQLLCCFKFKYLNNPVNIYVQPQPKQFKVSISGEESKMSELDSVIRFIVESAKEIAEEE